MMPNMDGWELCRRLRQSGDFPLLMITAKGETSQKIKGFQLGTDDYLVKPFEPVELVARVKALLKRYRIASSQTVQVGDLIMDRRTNELTVRAAPHSSAQRVRLLFLLASYPGRTLSRDQLIEDIWGYDFEGNERTLDVHINRLRERFPEERHSFRIRTIRGLGYRLEAHHEAAASRTERRDVLISLAFVMSALTVSFYLTGFLYDRTGWHPPALAIQIINAFFG